MTDWSKYKVADLKEECKSRDISLTGLKLKQQYVDKLVEYEAQNGSQANEAEEKDDTHMTDGEPAQTTNGESTEPVTATPMEVEDTRAEGPTPDVDVDKPSADIVTAESGLPQKQESHAEEDQDDQERPTIQALPPAADVEPAQDALPVPEPEDLDEKLIERREEDPADALQNEQQGEDVKVRSSDEKAPSIEQAPSSLEPQSVITPQPTQVASSSSTPHTSQVPPSDLAEDQRKRKKRSATPVPSSEEISPKRARLSEEAQEMKGEEAMEQVKAATEVAKEIRNEEENNQSAVPKVEDTAAGATSTDPAIFESKFKEEDSKYKEEDSKYNEEEPKYKEEESTRQRPRSRSPAEERDIPPAIHPATSSVYISRLKRPLQPQVFRSHIISKAKSRSSDDSDPITSFYLDSIKTHAFVSFTSISAASRVRTAMHGVKFPEEASRDPLFVDYVPDEQVQNWIDQETESGFGRVSGGRRLFEVVYEEGENGIEARFQEIDSSKPRPPLEPSRNSRMSFDRQQGASAPVGVHPDRATPVPRDNQRPLPPPTGPKKSASDTGRGFKALDELFKSTTAKPKLYYKPVPAEVSSERLDMFRDLRVGHDQMGRSGEEGMKRYTFDRVKDKEEWVDKGPEFGHGRRGQERLVGGDRGFRGRGRGGGYRGRQMDSWRGGGR